MLTWGARYWPWFIAITSGWLLTGLGIPEGIALATNVRTHLDNTFSHYLRSELHVSIALQGSVHTVAWWASFTTWIVFVVFITGHIWFNEFG